jgi:fumarate reductase flavoprotein subunit
MLINPHVGAVWPVVSCRAALVCKTRKAFTMHPRLVLSAAVIAAVAFAAAALAQSPPPNLASFHAQKLNLPCAACHGESNPAAVPPEQALATADQKCTGCHGDAKTVAAALRPKLKDKNINPHASHLVQIDCVTCHHGHTAAESYCVQCHAFDMPMPPRAQAK